jgi:Rad3-related DNA helicase
MKYKEEILTSYERLGYSPRGEQLEYVNKIISSYLDDKKKIVILSAPTGTGKSIIGAVVADVLHELDRDSAYPCDTASFILMSTNILTKQYADSFKDKKDFILVKGANNYPCEVLSTTTIDETAASCCENDFLKSEDPDLMQVVAKYCKNCEFAYIKRQKHYAKHLITNFSYFFIDRLFTQRHDKRTLTVWDEAHTLNDAFAEHCAVFISEKRLLAYAEELGEHLTRTDIKVPQTFKKIREAIKNKTITEKNYLILVEELRDSYLSIKELATLEAKSLMTSNMPKYSKLQKISKKYADLSCKISDLLHYNYEHIFELNDFEKEVSIKPIFVGTMFNQLINSKFQLFMSATVSEELLVSTLGLDPIDIQFIKLPSTFPIENKKVVFLGIEKLNYTTMKDPKVINKLSKACLKLVNRHEGENGIILTPSFDVTEKISELLLANDVNLFQHERGTPLSPLLDIFKKSKTPGILISPSLFEGISLDDDLSRFQIFVKTPYLSLGSKRVKYIADNYSQIYSLSAILKLVQGAGRSVRHEEDFAITYCLDNNISWMWKSKQNIWQNEFSSSFQMLL